MNLFQDVAHACQLPRVARMIHRTRDAALVGHLAEKQGQERDFTDLLAEPSHVCLRDGDSLAFFIWCGPGIYEVHLCLAVRGREALSLFRQMIETMRNEYGARLFWGLIPTESRRVIMFIRLSGWRYLGQKITRHGAQELFVLEAGLCL